MKKLLKKRNVITVLATTGFFTAGLIGCRTTGNLMYASPSALVHKASAFITRQIPKGTGRRKISAGSFTGKPLVYEPPVQEAVVNAAFVPTASDVFDKAEPDTVVVKSKVFDVETVSEIAVEASYIPVLDNRDDSVLLLQKDVPQNEEDFFEEEKPADTSVPVFVNAVTEVSPVELVEVAKENKELKKTEGLFMVGILPGFSIGLGGDCVSYFGNPSADFKRNCSIGELPGIGWDVTAFMRVPFGRTPFGFLAELGMRENAFTLKAEGKTKDGFVSSEVYRLNFRTLEASLLATIRIGNAKVSFDPVFGMHVSLPVTPLKCDEWEITGEKRILEASRLCNGMLMPLWGLTGGAYFSFRAGNNCYVILDARYAFDLNEASFRNGKDKLFRRQNIIISLGLAWGF